MTQRPPTVDELAPLPDRSLANRIWKELPRQVRQEVFGYAAHGHAHPDPVTSWTALARARARRSGPQWSYAWAVSLYVASLVGLWLVPESGIGYVEAALLGLGTGSCVGLAAQNLPGRWDAAVETTNLRTAMAAGWLRTSLDGPTRISTGRIPRPLVVVLAVGVVQYLGADEFASWERWAATAVGTLPLGGVLSLFLPPRARTVVLDEYGLHIRKVVVPWREIAWVETCTIRYSWREYPAVRWQLKNPAGFVTTPSERRRKRNAGGSVNVPFFWLTVTPEDAILLSRRHLERVSR